MNHIKIYSPQNFNTNMYDGTHYHYNHNKKNILKKPYAPHNLFIKNPTQIIDEETTDDDTDDNAYNDKYLYLLSSYKNENPSQDSVYEIQKRIRRFTGSQVFKDLIKGIIGSGRTLSESELILLSREFFSNDVGKYNTNISKTTHLETDSLIKNDSSKISSLTVLVMLGVLFVLLWQIMKALLKN